MQTIGHNRALMKQITANRLIAHIAHHALSPLKKTHVAFKLHTYQFGDIF